MSKQILTTTVVSTNELEVQVRTVSAPLGEFWVEKSQIIFPNGYVGQRAFFPKGELMMVEATLAAQSGHEFDFVEVHGATLPELNSFFEKFVKLDTLLEKAAESKNVISMASQHDLVDAQGELTAALANVNSGRRVALRNLVIKTNNRVNAAVGFTHNVLGVLSKDGSDAPFSFFVQVVSNFSLVVTLGRIHAAYHMLKVAQRHKSAWKRDQRPDQETRMQILFVIDEATSWLSQYAPEYL